jgi:hypothetical protein
MLRLDYSEKLPAIDVVPGKTDLAFSDSPVYGLGYFDTLFLFASSGDQIEPGQEMHYITVATSGLEGPNSSATVHSVFGDTVGVASGPVYVVYSSSIKGYDITEDRIVSVDGTPVFVASN